ncbi:MAG: transglutaminase domain-containing protein [Clostridia bacterium]|nr:transglutaminase domain-containing protein [Clostridia bacterium]
MKRAILVMLFLCLALFFGACAPDDASAFADMDLTPIDLRVAVGGARPTAEDFLSDEARARCQKEGVTVEFAVEPDFDTVGEQTVTLALRDGAGNERELPTRMVVVEDTTPPTLTGVKEISARVGEGLILREGVSAVDDCFGAVEWTVDASAVDTEREGLYSATYRAVDASGNVTERTVYVHIYAMEITSQMLWEKLDPLLSGLYGGQDSIEQKCRAIHAYVQANIKYFPISDKSNTVRAAYDALFGKGRGDCYSYFAAALVMLDRAGIEYLGIERTHEEGEETHFWLMVNLAQKGEAARWYHFDPTLVDGGGAAGKGCLFTDAQLDEYNAIDPGFYDYNRADYPPTATEIITQ